jgi:beta-xylosidase
MKNMIRNRTMFFCWIVSSLAIASCRQDTPQHSSNSFGGKAYVSSVWVADQGDGTYKNPVIHADYSDPDVIRVGDDYFMTSSSFNCMPGLPILHSTDLVNWSLIGYALKKQYPEELFQVPQHGNGVWAPSMRYRNGEFYIYWGDPDQGIFMVKTKDPAGEWEQPVLVMPGKGLIDSCPLWDDDGNAYLVHGWAGSRAGVNSLLTVHRMSDDGTKLLDEGKHVFDGHGNHPTLEGPKFYKRNNYYYIFAPAGGVATGWQLILRSKNIYGPYEEKIVLEQGSTPVNGPHQGGWVETPTGESWFLHFQDKGAYGRVVHLQPVNWKEDWPLMGKDLDGNGIGEPVLSYQKPVSRQPGEIKTIPENDEFNSDTLGLQWQWHANPNVVWSALLKGNGFLRLFAFKQKDSVNLWDTPNLLLQKFPAPEFTATAKTKLTIEFDAWKGKRGGLIVSGNDYAYLAIYKRDADYFVGQVVCKNALKHAPEQVVEEKRLKEPAVYLRVSVKDAVCQFSYSVDGVQFDPIGTPFPAQPDKWIGSKVGLFCMSMPTVRNGSYIDVDWFRIEKNQANGVSK